MLWGLAMWVLGGCMNPGAEPLIEAHRAGAGYWPPNSRSAVLGTISADFDGIEIDLALAADGVPVLHHDPFLSPEHCTVKDGGELNQRIRIDEVESTVLFEEYLCGGTPNINFPNAEVVSDPIISFDEALTALIEANPDLRVHLDVKYEDGWTHPAADFAEQILERWWAADLPQPMVVSCNTVACLTAFEDHGRLAGRDVFTVRIYPFAAVDSSSVSVGLGAEADSLLGKVDYVALVEEAGADGIAVNFEVAERHQLAAAQQAGLETSLWTVNGAALDFYADWPVDVLISDLPPGRR